MKVVRAELIEALRLVQPGVAAKGDVDQATSFIFLKNKVCTYNDEVAVSHPLKIGFTGAVPAKEFYQLISKINAEEIELSIMEGELSIKGSRAKAGLRIEAEVTLPLEEMGMSEEWVEIPANFCDAVSFCLFSVSKDANSPVLTCLNVTNKFVESSDNYRVTRYPLEKSKAFKEGVLIPAFAAKEIIKYKPVEFATTEGWIHFKNENNVVYSCRTMEEEFPDLGQYLEIKGSELVFPNNLGDMLDRASVLCEDERAIITIDEGVLTLQSENKMGWFEEKVRIKYTGETIDFGIQPAFLKSILSITNKAIIGKMMKFEGDSFIHVVSLLRKNKGDNNGKK